MYKYAIPSESAFIGFYNDYNVYKIVNLFGEDAYLAYNQYGFLSAWGDSLEDLPFILEEEDVIETSNGENLWTYEYYYDEENLQN